MEKKTLQTTDNTKVGIAIAREEGLYFVQTTELQSGNQLAEMIAEDIQSKEEALAIAKDYQDLYGFQLVDWTDSEDNVANVLQRVIEQMKEWDKDRLIQELESFILQADEKLLVNLFFDDIATEEEHAADKIQR